MEAWGAISLTIGTSTANLKQLYPSWAPVGVDPATANAGDAIRRPTAGTLYGLQIKTDGTNGGTLELYDVSGHDRGIDVSSLSAITNAELALLVADGVAKLIYEQNFVADGTTPPRGAGPIGFMHGLAARVVGSTGTAQLNVSIEGGFILATQAGDA